MTFTFLKLSTHLFVGVIARIQSNSVLIVYLKHFIQHLLFIYFCVSSPFYWLDTRYTVFLDFCLVSKYYRNSTCPSWLINQVFYLEQKIKFINWYYDVWIGPSHMLYVYHDIEMARRTNSRSEQFWVKCEHDTNWLIDSKS